MSAEQTWWIAEIHLMPGKKADSEKEPAETRGVYASRVSVGIDKKEGTLFPPFLWYKISKPWRTYHNDKWAKIPRSFFMRREPLNASKATPGPKPVVTIKPGGGKHTGGGILPTIKPKTNGK